MNFGSLDDLHRHPCQRAQKYPCIRCGMDFAKPEDADRHIATCGDRGDTGGTIKWTPAQEEALIQQMNEKYQSIVTLPNNQMKKEFWVSMTETLGYEKRLWIEVRRKWSNTCLTYRRKKDLAGPRNSGRGANKHWPHFEGMDEILSDSPATAPAYVIATNEPVRPTTARPSASKRPAAEMEGALNEAETPTTSGGRNPATPTTQRKRQRSSEDSPAVTYQRYLTEKMRYDARKAENDDRRTQAIVNLVACFKAAADKENVAPHQKLVNLAKEFIRVSNEVLVRDGQTRLTQEQTVEVFRDIVSGLEAVRHDAA